MVKINLKSPEEIAKDANKIKYSYDKERKNGLFVFISERIKAFFMNIKL